MKNRLLNAIVFSVLFVMSGCSLQGHDEEGRAHAKKTDQHGEIPHKAHARKKGIAIPESVRDNLRITFAKVESRRVAKTLRLPGRFETPPRAHREYRTAMAGRIELIARQYDKVKAGTPLYRLDSSEWRSLQKELLEAEATVETSFAAFAVSKNRANNLQKLIDLWSARIKELEKLNEAGGGRAAELAEAHAKKSELELEQTFIPKPCPLDGHASKCITAEEMASHAKHEAAKAHFEFHLNSAAAILGTTPEALSRETGPKGSKVPKWRIIRDIVVKATAPAVVEDVKVTSGTWVEANSLVYETVDLTALRFRAVSLQSDIGKLRDGMETRIVPPHGGTFDFQDSIKGSLRIGLEADPENRSIELIVIHENQASWARPGVSAFLEIVLDDSEDPELAIPKSSIVKDGLEMIFFRRNPRNPDEVFRVPADLGPSDGKWTVVYSGLMEGDEVVLDGVYELKLASSGQAQEADPHFGHNH